MTVTTSDDSCELFWITFLWKFTKVMKIYCDDIIAFKIHFERYFEIFIEMSVKIKKKKNREIYYCCILFLNVYWLFGITHNIQPEPSLTPQTFRKVSFKMYVGNFEKEIKESWYSEFPELIYFKAHLSGFLEIKNYSSGN